MRHVLTLDEAKRYRDEYLAGTRALPTDKHEVAARWQRVVDTMEADDARAEELERERDQWKEAHDLAAEASQRQGELLLEMEKPVAMRLPCPGCGKLHVDEGAFATKPHHTHSCQRCGLTWRPAVINTVGVQFLPGFKDPDKPIDDSRWYVIECTAAGRLPDEHGVIRAEVVSHNVVRHASGPPFEHAGKGGFTREEALSLAAKLNAEAV